MADHDDMENLFEPITRLQKQEIKVQQKIYLAVQARLLTCFWIALVLTVIAGIEIAEFT